jgi:hypothetical protein
MEHDLLEQIRALHSEHSALRERLVRVETAVSSIPDIDKKLDQINATLGKYQGFMGGIAFLFTGILLFVKGGWEVFTHWATK